MMPSLKLPRLPDRIPVKIILNVQPDLHQGLIDYATLYAEAYGEPARVEDLIPAMLTSFLRSDRYFTHGRGSR